MIVSLELPPGERLVESDLAGRLGVSKTPVREALAMLEADGLVEATPYRGASVRWLSMNESREQGYLVDALEMPAYPMVIERITKAELTATGKTVERLKRARKARDQREFAQLAGQIHEQMFACTGYPRLIALIHQVLGPVGWRYDNALVFPFDDSWDVLRDMAVARYESVVTRDLDTVIERRPGVPPPDARPGDCPCRPARGRPVHAPGLTAGATLPVRQGQTLGVMMTLRWRRCCCASNASA